MMSPHVLESPNEADDLFDSLMTEPILDDIEFDSPPSPRPMKPFSQPSISNLFQTQVKIDDSASKLNSLSAQERAQALEDLHGVANIEQEEPDRVAALLDQIDQSLALIIQRNDPNPSAYKQAVLQDAPFVKSYRLMCLRSENYCPQKAAERLVRFFTLKLEMFGANKLTQTITYDDLSGEDQKYLETGFLQMLNQRDRAGRAILMMVGVLNVGVPIPSVVSWQYSSGKALLLLFSSRILILQYVYL